MPNTQNDIEQLLFEDDGQIPNNPKLPALIYREALSNAEDTAAAFEESFHKNGWGGTWRWGVFDYHHFHSNAHEALGVASGSAELALGGPQGKRVTVRAGDLILLPAGTGHKNESSSPDFQVVGAYPKGQESYDTHRGDSSQIDDLRQNIRSTPTPDTDPLHGPNGPLCQLWD